MLKSPNRVDIDILASGKTDNNIIIIIIILIIIIIIIIIKVFIYHSLRKRTCNNLHEEIMINCN